MSALLTGCYRRILDDDFRLPLPRPLRDCLKAGEPLYLTPGLDRCLAIYPVDAFDALAQRLSAASAASMQVRQYARLLFSQAILVSLEGQSKIRIPPPLAAWASIAGETVVAGVRDHFEAWNPRRWDEYMARTSPHYDALAEEAQAQGTHLEALQRGGLPSIRTRDTRRSLAPFAVVSVDAMPAPLPK